TGKVPGPAYAGVRLCGKSLRRRSRRHAAAEICPQEVAAERRTAAEPPSHSPCLPLSVSPCLRAAREPSAAALLSAGRKSRVTQSANRGPVADETGLRCTRPGPADTRGAPAAEPESIATLRSAALARS